MKKILFLAMVATAMVSCSQNEEFENAAQKAEIKLGTVIKAGTKAAVTEIGDLETTGFIVNAYNTGTGKIGTALSTAFIDNKVVSHATGSWVISGGTYYWPLTDYVQFFAYAQDANATNYTVASNAGYPTIDYKVLDVANQKDFVVAKATDQQKSTTAISLPFTHVLTQVNFSVKAGNEALTYKVKDIKISGLFNTGTYSFADGTWTPSGTANASYTYPISTTEADVTVTGADAKSLTTTDGALMLMPQTMTAATNITVSYEVYNNGTKIDALTDSKIELNGKTDWAAGTNIRYTLTLTSEGATIDLDPSVDSWGTETSVPVPNETPAA